MTPLRLDAADVDDEKGRQALAQYTLEELDPSDRDCFDEAYRLLAAEFGPRGEIERREVVERWLFAPSGPKTYYLLVARDKEGRIAAVRDTHVRIATKANAVVAYLAHVLVLPEHRRTGIGALMRAAPIVLARRVAASVNGADILMAAEMEPVDPEVEATRIRLVAYARAGFSAIDPNYLPYAQPDFRDLARLAEEPQPIPLVAVIRWLGHEDAKRLPRRLAEAYVDVLYAVFGTHCREQDMAPSHAHALRALEGHDDVPLFSLPTKTEDLSAFGPLLKDRVLALHR